jgi:hypothetical protein
MKEIKLSGVSHISCCCVYAKCIIGIGVNGMLSIWERGNYDLVYEELDSKYVWVSKYKTHLIIGQKDNLQLYNWDLNSRKFYPIHTFAIGTSQISVPNIIRRKQYIFIQEGGTIDVFDIVTQSKIYNLNLGSEKILQVNTWLRISSDHLFVTETGKICVFNFKTGKLATVIQEKGHYYSLGGLVVAGDYLLCSVTLTGVRIWNWRTNQLLTTLPEVIPDSGFTQPGEMIRHEDLLVISSICDKEIRVWKLY